MSKTYTPEELQNALKDLGWDVEIELPSQTAKQKIVRFDGIFFAQLTEVRNMLNSMSFAYTGKPMYETHSQTRLKSTDMFVQGLFQSYFNELLCIERDVSISTGYKVKFSKFYEKLVSSDAMERADTLKEFIDHLNECNWIDTNKIAVYYNDTLLTYTYEKAVTTDTAEMTNTDDNQIGDSL
jgi:hypothetical protein